MPTLLNIFDPRLDKPYRYEFKYRVPTYLRAVLVSEFEQMGFKDDPFMRPDKFYFVTSIYFDTFAHADWTDKAGGYGERKKVRVRIYREQLTDETPEIWLEIKHKNDVRVFKEKTLLTRKQWRDFPNLAAGNDPVLAKALYYIFREQRRPTALVRYKRRIFLYDLAGFDVRFTFDYDLEACQSDTFGYNAMTKVAPGDCVLEVKFDRFLPAWFGFIVKKFNLRRDTFSKYALALETLRKFNPLPR